MAESHSGVDCFSCTLGPVVFVGSLCVVKAISEHAV